MCGVDGSVSNLPGMGLFDKNQKWSLTTSCGQLTTFGRLKKSGIEYVILEGSSLFAWSGSGQELSTDICRVRLTYLARAARDFSRISTF